MLDIRPVFYALLLGLGVLLAGCATSSRDGPPAEIPSGLKTVPDATPRVEAIRKGGPNKPYEIAGQRYEPMTADLPLVERGLASWYGKRFHGLPTASGEIYNMYAMTAAHTSMPIPSYARVRNPANGREVILRINDRGPFHKGRIIDLSYTAALKLDLLRGVGAVEVERITYEDIRTGAWQRGRGDETAPVYAAAPAADAPQQATTASVRGAAEPSPPAAPRAAARGFWLQLGAFARFDSAEVLRAQLASEVEWLAPLLAVFKDKGVNRLQAGPYATREDAQNAAQRLRSDSRLAPVVVEKK